MKKFFLLLCLCLALPTLAFAATHQDTQNNYQVTLPDGWKIFSRSDVSYEANEALYAENGSSSIFSVDIFDNPDFKKNENYSNAFSQQERQEMINETKTDFSKLYPGIVFDNVEFTNVNGVLSLVVTGTFTEKGKTKRLATFDTLQSSKVYIIYLVTEESLDTHKQIFWQIINTFKTLN